MNRISKIGLSALCGSLASVSAHAGEMSVSGGATVTWISNEGTATGNPLGMNSGLTFSGAGELDNGSTFTLTLTHADQDAWSAGSVAIATPSFGTFTFASANGGNGIDAKDDAMPTAWEETDGTGLTIGHDKISGVGASMNIGWKSPAFAGSTLSLAWAPRNNGVQNTDKASSGSSGEHKLEGMDVLLDMNTGDFIGAGSMNLFAGYSTSERPPNGKAAGTNADNYDDHEEGVVGAIFTVGPLKLGIQGSGEYTGNTQTTTEVAGYKNIAYGVSFNVNDNLSVSYGEHESTKGLVSSDNGSGNTKVVSEARSLQVAYTLGGAAFKFASTSVDNQNYTSGTTGDRDGMTVAMSLAF